MSTRWRPRDDGRGLRTGRSSLAAAALVSRRRARRRGGVVASVERKCAGGRSRPRPHRCRCGSRDRSPGDDFQVGPLPLDGASLGSSGQAAPRCVRGREKGRKILPAVSASSSNRTGSSRQSIARRRGAIASIRSSFPLRKRSLPSAIVGGITNHELQTTNNALLRPACLGHSFWAATTRDRSATARPALC